MPDEKEERITLGVLTARVQPKNVAQLRQEIAHGEFEHPNEKIHYSITQSIGGGFTNIEIEGKRALNISLKDIIKLAIEQYDDIPDSKEGL